MTNGGCLTSLTLFVYAHVNRWEAGGKDGGSTAPGSWCRSARCHTTEPRSKWAACGTGGVKQLLHGKNASMVLMVSYLWRCFDWVSFVITWAHHGSLRCHDGQLLQEELQALKRRVSRTAELQSQVKAEAAWCRVGLEKWPLDTIIFTLLKVMEYMVSAQIKMEHYRFYKSVGSLSSSYVQLFNGLHFVIRPTQGNSRRLLRRQVTFKTHRQTCCDRIRPRLTTPCHLWKHVKTSGSWTCEDA